MYFFCFSRIWEMLSTKRFTNKKTKSTTIIAKINSRASFQFLNYFL